MPTSETPSPADNAAAAVRHDCVSCKPPSTSLSKRTCEKDSPSTSSSAEGEGKAGKKAPTREDLVKGAVSYAGGLNGMRAREDKEQRRLGRERQLYEVLLSKNSTGTRDVPKASSTPAVAPPAQATEAPTLHKVGSDDVVSAPEGSAAESTQTQDRDDGDGENTVSGSVHLHCAMRRAKSAR